MNGSRLCLTRGQLRNVAFSDIVHLVSRFPVSSCSNPRKPSRFPASPNIGDAQPAEVNGEAKPYQVRQLFLRIIKHHNLRLEDEEIKDYHINIFYSEEDEGYIADIPNLESCSAFGHTPKESASFELETAKQAWLEAAAWGRSACSMPAYRPAIYQAVP